MSSNSHCNLYTGHSSPRKSFVCYFTDSSFPHTQNKSFMRVLGRVELNTYRMRSRELQVAEEFLEHVKSLPLQYEKGIYFAFLEDYGTHYTKNGLSGGEYELIYVLNQDTIKEKSTCGALQNRFLSFLKSFPFTHLLFFAILADITDRQVQECVKIGITVDITGGAHGHLKPKHCENVTKKSTGKLSPSYPITLLGLKDRCKSILIQYSHYNNSSSPYWP